MKPLGPIPPGFEAIDGELAIGGRTASDAGRRGGRHAAVRLFGRADPPRAWRVLRAAMPERLRLHYAVKANPYRAVARTHGRPGRRLRHRFGAANSRWSSPRGIGPALVSFAGPGKRDAELEAAIAPRRDAQPRVRRRSAARAGDRRPARRDAAPGDPGQSRLRTPRLGDEDGRRRQAVRDRRRARAGAGPRAHRCRRRVARAAHLHRQPGARRRRRSPRRRRNVLALAAALADEAGHAPPHLNLGGGFGIPYFPGDQPLDVAAVGSGAGGALRADCPPMPRRHRSSRSSSAAGWSARRGSIWRGSSIARSATGRRSSSPTAGCTTSSPPRGNFGTVVRRNYPVAIATPLRRAARGGGERRRLPVHPARPPRRPGAAAARRSRRPGRDLLRRSLWRDRQPRPVPRPGPGARNAGLDLPPAPVPKRDQAPKAAISRRF